PPPADANSFWKLWKPLKDFAIGPILATARLFVIAFGLASIVVIDAVGFLVRATLVVRAPQIPVARLNRFLHAAAVALVARSLLACAGFYWIPAEEATLRRGGFKPGGKGPGLEVAPGDVIVANSQSYVELLYMAYRFDPVFTAVSPVDGTVAELSLLEALLLVGKDPVAELPRPGERLSQITRRAAARSKPVLVQPEVIVRFFFGLN
ncbi:MAG: hypothetical protein BJ554DRAFT_1578, partial [Olpidium bornovanus]